MVRQQQGLVKVKREVGMLVLLLKMITQLPRAVTGRLQQLQELKRNMGLLARGHKALTTDSHSKV